MTQAVVIRVSGKVQGVFFRASTKDKADQLGIKGFVRNESNGDVYIEAEGESLALEAFVEWCSNGPERARVDEFTVDQATVKNFNVFAVSR